MMKLLTTRPFSVSLAVPLLVFFMLIVVPIWGHATDAPFYVAFYARIIIYAIAALSLNLALGYGGLISFGHGLFLGIGAYSVAIPAFYGIDNGWFHLATCIVCCGVLGFITGALSLRISGIGFIMITLAFAQMGYFFFVSLKAYGGEDGTSIALTSKFLGVNLGELYTVYIVALIILALATWWFARIRVAPFGMVLRGAKQNSRRISAMGFATRRYLLTAYVLSAILCGIAGILLANLNAYASPTSMSWMVSGELIVMVVLGGMGAVFGPVLGALAFLGLEEILKLVTTHWMAIFGLAIVFIGLVGKAGIVGFLASIDQRWLRLRKGPQSSNQGDAHE